MVCSGRVPFTRPETTGPPGRGFPNVGLSTHRYRPSDPLHETILDERKEAIMSQSAGVLPSAETRSPGVGRCSGDGSGTNGDHGRVSENGPPTAAGILSELRQTPSLLPLTDRLGLAAACDATVLLTGET